MHDSCHIHIYYTILDYLTANGADEGDGLYQCLYNGPGSLICENYTIPTRNPTNMPSVEPSTMPTEVPSTIPTEIPTEMPSEVPTIVDPNDAIMGENIRAWELLTTIVVSCCVGFGILFSCFSIIHYRKIVNSKERFDSPKYFLIFKSFQGVADLWTDLSFSLIIYFENHLYLSFIALSFVLIPFLMQCIIAIYFVQKWKKIKINNPKRIKNYLTKYETLIYILTIVIGFYSTCDLLRSKLFYKEVFLFQLKCDEYLALDKFRFINVIIIENTIQLMIQFYYIFILNESDLSNINQIAIISMTFSILSLLLALIKEISRVCDNSTKTDTSTSGQSNNVNNDKYSHLTLLTGGLIVSSPDLTINHKFGHDRFQQCLSSILDTCDDHEYFTNKSDFIYFIEVYFIKDMIFTLNQCNASFEIKMLHYGTTNNMIIVDKLYHSINNIGSNTGNSNIIKIFTSSLFLDTITKISISQLEINTITAKQAKSNYNDKQTTVGRVMSNSQTPVEMSRVLTATSNTDIEDDDGTALATQSRNVQG